MAEYQGSNANLQPLMRTLQTCFRSLNLAHIILSIIIFFTGSVANNDLCIFWSSGFVSNVYSLSYHSPSEKTRTGVIVCYVTVPLPQRLPKCNVTLTANMCPEENPLLFKASSPLPNWTLEANSTMEAGSTMDCWTLTANSTLGSVNFRANSTLGVVNFKQTQTMLESALPHSQSVPCATLTLPGKLGPNA